MEEKHLAFSVKCFCTDLVSFLTVSKVFPPVFPSYRLGDLSVVGRLGNITLKEGRCLWSTGRSMGYLNEQYINNTCSDGTFGESSVLSVKFRPKKTGELV